MSSLLRLNDIDFPETINSSRPVLVSFGAPKQCYKCPKQKPALEELAQQGLPIFYVNLEEEDSEGINKSRDDHRVPLHRVYADGELLAQHVGLTEADVLETLLFEAEQTLKSRKRRAGNAVGSFGRW